jgi:hypothetical protein
LKQHATRQPKIFMRSSLFLLLFIVCQSLSASAQQASDPLALRYAATANADTTLRKHTGYYLVKFREFPGESLHQFGVIKSLDKLHYIVQHQKTDSSVDYILAAGNNWKATTNLLNILSSSDSLILLVNATQTPDYCRILQHTGRTYTVSLLSKDWQNFIAQPFISFADIQRKAIPEARISTIDLSANAISTAQQAYPAIKGEEITVSLKEDMFDTTDIDLTGRFIYNDAAAASQSSHATTMATMIAGAGNSGEKGLGAAPQALLCPANFTFSLLPDDSAYMRTYHISVQNHSYGTGIENYYGAEAVAYDEQPDTILHVFSSGNVGTTADVTGLYANISGYANLTGTFKQAKNVLVVGATDDSLHVPGISSKGPAYDGRIKPEVVAFGIDGSSGAAALTSGITALLQSAYKQVYHRTPAAALIKALLINSATANTISYSSGFGSIHAVHAIQALTQQHFLQGTGNGSFPIQVPAGVQKLKVTLCWNDPPATANAPSALVNDLDLTLTDASGHTYFPWVLSASPSKDSLAALPHRGRDSLNNVEQVSIDNPTAGTIQVNVHPYHLNTPSQVFYIAYSYEAQKHFEWQNPGNKEVIVAGSAVPFPVRWYSNISGTGDISCSYDKGLSWQTLAQQLNTANGVYYWTIPDSFCTALLKYTTADTAFVSDTFYLSPRLALQTGYDCGDSAMIYWNTLAHATAFQLYNMGSVYLLPYTQTIDTFRSLLSGSSPYYAVSPLHSEGWTGLKSYATNYQLQGTGCYFRNLLISETDSGHVLLNLSLGTTWHLKGLYWQRLSGKEYITIDSSAITTDITYDYEDIDPQESGLAYYRVQLVNSNGDTLYSDPASIYLLRQHDHFLFPNPVTNLLTVVNRTMNNMQLQLFDISGRLVLTRQLNSTQESLSVGQLPAGIYVGVLLDDGKKVFSQRLLKR